MNKALDHYECKGQLSIFDMIKPVCNFSGHICNKKNLWEIADTLDDLMCPHVCCRLCNTRLCGARCNGKPFNSNNIPIDNVIVVSAGTHIGKLHDLLEQDKIFCPTDGKHRVKFVGGKTPHFKRYEENENGTN